MKCRALSVVALALSACSVYSSDAGHEVVLIEKPWLFGHGGVGDTPVKTGRTWAAFTERRADQLSRNRRVAAFRRGIAHQELRAGDPGFQRALARELDRLNIRAGGLREVDLPGSLQRLWFDRIQSKVVRLAN
jgi:hypothetical protein